MNVVTAVQEVPARIRPWLYDHGSLTRRLVQAVGAGFHVQLLGQTYGLPEPDEAHQLSLSPDEVVLLREVLLKDGETPLVYARSVIPQMTITGDQAYLGKQAKFTAEYIERCKRTNE